MILTSSKAELGDGAKEFYKFFYDIHESVKVKDSKISTSRHYIKFLNAFKNIYEKKRSTIAGRQGHLKVLYLFISRLIFMFHFLQNGVNKLNEAKNLVNELEKKAKIQRAKLSEKQLEADAALNEITKSMQGAGEQK